VTTRISRIELLLSLLLAGGGEVLWLMSWMRAQGAPQLPARAIWSWPLSWVACLALGCALSWFASKATTQGMQGMALAGGMMAQLLSRVLVMGVPLLVLFFAVASLLSSS
jgi:hypothetical protein